MPRFEPGEFDEIYHLAAAVGVRLVIEQPIHTIETNVLETSALLEFAAAGRTPTLLASTSEVYGKGSRDAVCRGRRRRLRADHLQPLVLRVLQGDR